jgi:hypothetical protein
VLLNSGRVTDDGEGGISVGLLEFGLGFQLVVLFARGRSAFAEMLCFSHMGLDQVLWNSAFVNIVFEILQVQL